MNQPSSSTQNNRDSDDEDMDGVIEGVDVMPHLDTSTDDGNNDNEDLVQAINRFMRNEVDYDEFMRVTGGKTLDEELAEEKAVQNGNASNNIEEDDEIENDDREEEFDVNEDESDDEDPNILDSVDDMDRQSMPQLATSYYDTGSKYDALPEESRYIMTQMMAGERSSSSNPPPKNLAEVLSAQFTSSSNSSTDYPPAKTIKTEISEDDPSQEPRNDTKDRGKSKRMDALLGQANVLCARGNITDAMELLREVIRQDHKHPVAYQQIASVYEQQGETQKALQFGLLASHLDPRTPAEDWIHWGDEAKKLGMLEEAAVCFDRAIHLNNENWKYYEKRIEILDQLHLRQLSMKTRLQAAQNINHEIANVDFTWFRELIRKVAQYYITINDEDKAVQALEAFVLRSREFDENADRQHEILVGMHLEKNKYSSAGKSILALSKGITAVHRNNLSPACEISYNNGTYECTPFPPVGDVTFTIDNSLFPVQMHCHLLICLFNLDETVMAMDLEEKLLSREFTQQCETNLLSVAAAYKNKGKIKLAMKYLEDLTKNESYSFDESHELFYLKGALELALKNEGEAMKAFEKVLSIKPDHVDSRIHLSTLQQKSGLFEDALNTLRNYDLDTGTSLPDERLLARQSEILFESGDLEQFVRITRMLLAPHFYQIYTAPEGVRKRRPARAPALSNTLRVGAMAVIKHTNWERLIKRLGASAEESGRDLNDMDARQLHDYCLRLVECLHQLGKHQDAMIVCCYSFLHPKMHKVDQNVTFQNLIYFCAIKSRNWSLAFEFVRFFHTFSHGSKDIETESPAYLDMLYKRIFNAMNFVFVNSQSVSYHRFIMRALVKQKDNHALQAISGNNSLITGTYRHALGEYLRVYMKNKKNPLICLLLGLTFTHMSCKKDLSSRHLICIRGIAFVKKYARFRTCTQEIHYNIARMFHQLSILPLAKHFYEKVLESPPPNVYYYNDEGVEVSGPAEKYDLSKMAAHNLALMYRAAGNIYAAREVYEKYLVV